MAGEQVIEYLSNLKVLYETYSLGGTRHYS